MQSNKGIINPIEEIAAYETLWERHNATFKRIADIFRSLPGSKPSDFVSRDELNQNIEKIKNTILELRKKKNYKPNILINNTYDYPDKLREARDPIELLYYTGNIGLINNRSIAIVGARKPSDAGIRRTKKLTKLLVDHGFTIVSGLATGIDTAAHSSAIENLGNTIAVIGTPLNMVYPKENNDLQNLIAEKHLLISQVPFLKYESQDYRINRTFFPERNKTMSALTEATVIVEASNTSGSLIQARAAIQQGRKLFILNSCFENKDITWPAYYSKKGAIRVYDFNDILNNLKS